MAQAPDTLVLERNRDLAGRENEIWVRRGLFALLCVVPVLALLNVFGQRPAKSAVDVENNIEREPMTADELAEEMRVQQIASFDEVQWAILENNG